MNHSISIIITIILNGELVLLLQEANTWKLPKGNILDKENGMKSIKRILLDHGLTIEEVLEEDFIYHDNLIKPWNLNITESEIIINYGLCYTSEKITDITTENNKWVPLEDCHKISIDKQHEIIIRNYIQQVNTELENSKLLKIVRENIS